MADNGLILVTGAVGKLVAVGRTVTGLLLDRGLPVRAMVRREDDRAASDLKSPSCRKNTTWRKESIGGLFSLRNGVRSHAPARCQSHFEQGEEKRDMSGHPYGQ